LNVATTSDWLEPLIVPWRKPVMVIGVSLGSGVALLTCVVRYVIVNGVWSYVVLIPSFSGATRNSPRLNDDGAVYCPVATLLKLMTFGPVMPVRPIEPDVL
jgi:hypothetical protein